MEMDDEYAMKLIYAILVRAVMDYRGACRWYAEHRKKTARFFECERFFKSAWGESLTQGNGEYFISLIRKECGLGMED